MVNPLNSKFKRKKPGFTSIQRLVRRRITVSAVLIAFAGAVAIPMAKADQYADQISQLQQHNSHSHNKVDALQLYANDIEDAIAKLQKRINDLQAKIKANQKKSAELKDKISEAEKELEHQKDVLGQNIKAMYLEDEISTLEMLATSKDLSQFVDKQQYRDAVKDKIKQQVDLITELKLRMKTQRSEIEKLIKEDQELKEEISANKAEQDRLLSLNLAQQAEFNNKIRENNKKIAELRAAQQALANALSKGTYKAAPVGPVSAGSIIGTVGNTGLSTGAHLHLEVRIGGSVTNPTPYIKEQPVTPTHVVQAYGNYDPIYASGYHPGIDYAPGDWAIHAIDSGTLYRGCSDDLLATSTNPYGYVAIIEHPGGHFSVYGHMAGGPAACNYNTYY